MVITTENLERIKQDNLIHLWNIFAREEWGSQIYSMEELDDVLCDVKPSKLLDMIDKFDVRDACFYYDDNELLTSDSWNNAVDAVVDFEALAEDISKDTGRYRDEIECDEYAEILLYGTELNTYEWEGLMVCYTPMEIETVRNAKITKAEAQALREVKNDDTVDGFDTDVDYLLTYCRVEG